MRFNTLVTLGASAAFGVLSIILARAWINDAIRSELDDAPAQVGAAAQPRMRTIPVLVADVDLNFGDRITPQSLRLVDMPEDLVPTDSFSNFDSLFIDDTPIVALTQTRFNEPILSYKISGPHGRKALSQLVSEGMRAVSIRSNATAGVAGFVLPGDRVDILLTRDVAEDGQDRELQTELLLQDVKVLGVDQNAMQSSEEINVPQNVTVEVTPEQAQILTLSMDIGSLSLTLRRAGALDVQPPIRISEDTLQPVAEKPKYRVPSRKAGSQVAARKSSPDTAQVTIVRSGKKSQVSVRVDDGLMPAAAASETADPALAPAIDGELTLVGGEISDTAFEKEEG